MSILDIVIILLIGINTATINNLFVNYILFMILGVSFGIYIGVISVIMRIEEEKEKSGELVREILESLINRLKYY